jgi:hypothetical protein
MLCLAAALPLWPETVTNRDILDMVKAGLSETVIIEKLRLSETALDVSTSTLVSLKEHGVSAAILSAMLRRASEEKPRPSTDAEYGTVYVYRPEARLSFGTRPYLYVGPSHVARLPNAQHVVLKLPPGPHTIAWAGQDEKIQLDIGPGTVHYLRAILARFKTKLEVIADTQASEELKRTRLIEPKYIERPEMIAAPDVAKKNK